MKKWVLCIAVLFAAKLLFGEPFEGTDVAKLQPVQLLRVSLTESGVLLETETGDLGEGQNIREALDDMKAGASANIFLETAEFLLVADGARELLPELTEVLRPGCAVCIASEIVDLEQGAAYLAAHRPEVSLNDVRAGKMQLPHLVMKEGRLELEEPEDQSVADGGMAMGSDDRSTGISGRQGKFG